MTLWTPSSMLDAATRRNVILKFGNKDPRPGASTLPLRPRNKSFGGEDRREWLFTPILLRNGENDLSGEGTDELHRKGVSTYSEISLLEIQPSNLHNAEWGGIREPVDV